EAETMLGYASIRAPFNGIITKKLADVGDLAMPGRPIVEMEDPSALRFEANVPETLFHNIKISSELDIEIAGLSAPIKGVVAELSPTADPNSRTFLVKFDLPNEARLRAGQFGHVSVPSNAETLISIPKAAIVNRGQMEVVYVVRDGKAWLRLVRTGKQIGESFEILSGLEDGEVIVADGASDLRDGQLVQEVK
ncbi:MAG: efflux RND transporter periplasmic adaptor subunit, partial [SAR324 cluster bacterium]|nr:efflux RND transporter periplasmic adaptor subunit [SAR324 cluster bacterium]